MNDLRTDINLAKQYITRGYNQDLFDYIYPFCNENIKDLLSYFPLKDKKCLSVLASSDQIFDMFLNGARSITAFDINKLTIYYYNLKKAAIMAGLSFEDYKRFFCFEEYIEHHSNKDVFDYDTFKIIKKYLDNKSNIFWLELYKCFSAKEIRIPFGLFTYDEPSNEILHQTVGYFNESAYKELQTMINKLDIDFINTNIKSLPVYLDSKYDFMYFSNIIQYCDLMFDNYDNLDKEANKKIKLLKMKSILNYLANYLNKNGYMVAGYLYAQKNSDKNNAILDKKLRNEIFNEENYLNLYLRSIQSFTSKEIFESTNLKQDMCLIYKK